MIGIGVIAPGDIEVRYRVVGDPIVGTVSDPDADGLGEGASALMEDTVVDRDLPGRGAFRFRHHRLVPSGCL